MIDRQSVKVKALLVLKQKVEEVLREASCAKTALSLTVVGEAEVEAAAAAVEIAAQIQVP